MFAYHRRLGDIALEEKRTCIDGVRNQKKMAKDHKNKIRIYHYLQRLIKLKFTVTKHRAVSARGVCGNAECIHHISDLANRCGESG